MYISIVSNLILDGVFKIAPGASNAKVKVNGVAITSELQLHHKDRIVLGSNHVYVFTNPKAPVPSEGTPETDINWEFAQKELAENSGFSSAGLTAEQVFITRVCPFTFSRRSMRVLTITKHNSCEYF